MSYTFKPKTAAEPSTAFYKPPSAGFSRQSTWSSSKPAAPPEPKVDVKDYAAFPSLSMPPRASLRLPSKELPPPPKLGAWTAVAAKAPAPVLMPKPEVVAAAGGAGYQFPSHFGNGPNRIFTEEEAMMMEHCPPEERAARLAWIKRGASIGTRCFDDGPEDYDGPEE